MRIGYFGICLTVLLGFSSGRGEGSVSRQKLFLFLKEPLAGEPVKIHLDGNLDNALEPLGPEESPIVNLPAYKIIFNSSEHRRRSLSIEVPQDGYVKLEVYDLYGKSLGTLFERFCPQGIITIEEDEKWKSFLTFNGVAFFMLSINDALVLKKLIPKVE